MLLTCPAKGWFRPMRHTITIDDPGAIMPE
jgi:hypothetical protein